MRRGKGLIACITGEKASLRPTMAGADVARRLDQASGGYNSPYEGIKVLTVDRQKLLRLAAHIQSPPVIYGICVNGKRTGLTVEDSALFSYSLIIVKVEGQSIMMHGMEDGAEPRLVVCPLYACEIRILIS